MIQKKRLAQAIDFASKCFRFSFDKGGEPYILHLIRVMQNLETEDEDLKIIAIYHDFVEDIYLSMDVFSETVSFGDSKFTVNNRILSAIDCLSKRKGETYDQYLERVASNHDAILVKLADLKDNMDLSRLKRMGTAEDLIRMEKYEKAKAFLEEKLLSNQINFKSQTPI